MTSIGFEAIEILIPTRPEATLLCAAEKLIPYICKSVTVDNIVSVFIDIEGSEDPSCRADGKDPSRTDEPKIEGYISDLLIDVVIMLRKIDDIVIIVTVQQKEFLDPMTECLEISAIGIQCYFIDEDQAILYQITAELREIYFIATNTIKISKNRSILTFSFTYFSEFRLSDFS